MMYQWGWGPMMGGSGGTLGFITWAVWLAVGVLLLVWLWRQIAK